MTMISIMAMARSHRQRSDAERMAAVPISSRERSVWLATLQMEGLRAFLFA
jgi:hypothetical protein